MPNPPAAAESRSSERLADVARIAALAPVEAAAAWFITHGEGILDLQMEVTRIPAPPFG